ncbi:hypothetical protein C2E20_3750 [Micractinium conductrix]|uniref:Uncharacterized protein n=1 Tax=Micractinium conductrix TaxID=554055 RepID=A0A2P6VGH7_9CHLO|nr:hypothetical protein C2E20_3750 [Micractinium conductrix]|eukprot:PSC73190.1 hypothetical protein C2E20_3750 [Micractinium conductrix]
MMQQLRCCRCACAAAQPATRGPTCVALRSAPHRLAFDPLQHTKRQQAAAARAAADSSSGAAAGAGGGGDEQAPVNPALAKLAEMDSVALPDNFCIIESPESVKDFATLQVDEIEKNIAARRNKIFLLMEEVRRLRIQLRLKGISEEKEDILSQEEYPSSIPFFPPITEKTIQLYWRLYAFTVAFIIAFGGLVAPVLELKLGVGGTSYMDVIKLLHLPTQLAEVDPIVASFCGGSVGVLTALLIVEANNAKMQEKRRCIYCEGTGYLTCGTCVGTGMLPGGDLCANCAGTGKVMCTSCLCTGKKLATEHDPRVDPFTLGMD